MKQTVYLDYAATTPCDPLVAEKMMRYLAADGVFANATSTHASGKKALGAVETARAEVADLIQAEPSEIIWTSGATESNNLAIKGGATLYQAKGKHIITLKTEHASVLDSCHYLEKHGFCVTYLTPQANGLVDIHALEANIRPDTILVSVMHVNNETGVIQDIKKIAALVSSQGILFHVDAVQSVGKIPFSIQDIPVDFVSLSAHKLYGPKGVGALYIRRKPRVRVAAQLHGGGQESGMRSGTLATHQIVGMGEAFALAKSRRENDFQKIKKYRDLFLEKVSSLKTVSIHSSFVNAFPGIINLQLEGMEPNLFLEQFPALSVSWGSACLSKKFESSHVLRALGLTDAAARASIRFSFGRFTTDAEILYAVECLRSYRRRG